mmetsp:Transcript_86064/g.256783  ORF Transcript_86064/g.256783 Transcript_86064/m.256783 type:complete len:204 (+) Transcript_86064:119-730(+)
MTMRFCTPRQPSVQVMALRVTSRSVRCWKTGCGVAASPKARVSSWAPSSRSPCWCTASASRTRAMTTTPRPRRHFSASRVVRGRQSARCSRRRGVGSGRRLGTAQRAPGASTPRRASRAGVGTCRSWSSSTRAATPCAPRRHSVQAARARVLHPRRPCSRAGCGEAGSQRTRDYSWGPSSTSPCWSTVCISRTRALGTTRRCG